MSIWRKLLSFLLPLGGALIGFLLASQRRTGSPGERQADAASQKRIDDLAARVTATQQAVVVEQKKQSTLAQQAASLDEQLDAVHSRVEGLSHDNLDAEIHRALDGTAGASAAPSIVKPGGVIKPAS